VRVYRNLLKPNFFSIQAMEGPNKGKVVGYARAVGLENVTFVVSKKPGDEWSPRASAPCSPLPMVPLWTVWMRYRRDSMNESPCSPLSAAIFVTDSDPRSPSPKPLAAMFFGADFWGAAEPAGLYL